MNAAPGDWGPHSYLADALAATNDLDGAIAEARESIRVAPNNPQTLVKLSRYLEKKGDLNGALAQCKIARQWNLADEEITHCGEIEKHLGVEVTFVVRSLGAMASSAKTAAESIASKNTSPATANLTAQTPHPAIALKPGEAVESVWQNLFDTGKSQFSVHNFADAEQTLEMAATLSEKLQPFNERNLSTFDMLGATYFMDHKLPEARITFQRELDLTEKALGARSEQNERALSELAAVVVAQNDFATAETLYLRLIDNSEQKLTILPTPAFRYSYFSSASFIRRRKLSTKRSRICSGPTRSEKVADGDEGPVAEMFDGKTSGVLYRVGQV